MSAIYDLMADVRRFAGLPADYVEKMMHPVPGASIVKREQYLMEAVRGKCVLDIGCSGELSRALGKIAREYYGIDIIDIPGLDHVYLMDIDAADELPEIPGVEVVIASEVIEHLSNAGHFLDLLQRYDCPVILTTVNAYSEAGYRMMLRGVENVNREHVAYYSYHTLRGLVERHGWRVEEWHWYNGQPYTAEGLVFRIVR